MIRRLGRLAPDRAHLATMPRFGDYAPKDWPAVGVDWSRNVAPGTYGMDGNDTQPNCTAVAYAHALMTWGAYAPPMAILAQPAIDALFAATGSPEGAVCLDVLHYLIGTPVGGQKLSAFATVDPRNTAHVTAGVEMFGGVYAGITIRQSQMDADPGDGVWEADNSPIVGGHCVWIVGANASGLTCVTWGAVQRMTWAFWQQAAEEAYALLSPTWIKAGRTPAGFQTAALTAAMANL